MVVAGARPANEMICARSGRDGAVVVVDEELVDEVDGVGGVQIVVVGAIVVVVVAPIPIASSRGSSSNRTPRGRSTAGS